jgi:hypothetical protein
MIGELEQLQIKTLLEQGAVAEDVAKELGIEVALVKLVGAKAELVEDRDITDSELQYLRKHAYNLATGADSHEVQSRMTMFLLERDRPSKKEASVNIIAQINQNLLQGVSRFEELAKVYKEES